MAKYPSRTDIVTAMRNPQVSYKCAELIGGSIIQKGSRVIQYSGGYTTVFPFNSREGRKKAVRLWIADIGDAKKRSLKISEYLKKLNSKYFVSFNYVDNAVLINGNLFPIVIMDWVNGITLKEYINKHILESNKILALAESFREMTSTFHQFGIAHGDLQHGNILVKPNGEVLVIDYDSMFIKPLEGMPDIIKGLAGYQHPNRRSNKFLDFRLDYFSELIIYLSLLIFAKEPSLWKEFYETEDLLFSINDFEYPDKSAIINRFLNYSESSISGLTSKLITSLKENDITNLYPLEELLIDELKLSKESIFDKIDSKQSYSTKEVVLPKIKDITDKF